MPQASDWTSLWDYQSIVQNEVVSESVLGSEKQPWDCCLDCCRTHDGGSVTRGSFSWGCSQRLVHPSSLEVVAWTASTGLWQGSPGMSSEVRQSVLVSTRAGRSGCVATQLRWWEGWSRLGVDECASLVPWIGQEERQRSRRTSASFPEEGRRCVS